MFNSVFSLLGSPASWRRSPIELCEVPDAPGPESSPTQRLLTVAGGLALVLSRCPRGQEKRSFPATVELYDTIRRRLRRGSAPRVDAELLLESFHEVAGKLDPASRVAFRECLEAERERDRQRRPQPAKSKPGASRDDTRAPLTSSAIEVLEIN
ncbi:hypothetical protein [Ramlibacter humi]|uniref:Uncharacterized protein n=1 Tax=Ramlibacter humi TaxID=2530451 RepID=A0A4Z0BLS0_9BURK|nr:hypothetical protein [Ramlibacter humi]TFZ00277.1 hypothetical protein EZ216_14350 [Ramlibacter humi]